MGSCEGGFGPGIYNHGECVPATRECARIQCHCRDGLIAGSYLVPQWTDIGCFLVFGSTSSRSRLHVVKYLRGA